MKKLSIAIEGIDGCGKSTLLPWLASEVSSLTMAGVVATHVLGKGGVGMFGHIPEALSERLYNHSRKYKQSEHIQSLLALAFGGVFNSYESNLLLSAARHNTFGNVVMPAIDAGCSVVTDRSVFSSYAYSRFMHPEKFIAQLNSERITIGGRYIPSIVILLNVDTVTAIERRLGRDLVPSDNDLNSVEFFDNVSERYLRLAKNYSDYFVVVDANQSIESVKADIMAELIKKLNLATTLGV